MLKSQGLNRLEGLGHEFLRSFKSLNPQNRKRCQESFLKDYSFCEAEEVFVRANNFEAQTCYQCVEATLSGNCRKLARYRYKAGVAIEENPRTAPEMKKEILIF